MRLHYSYLPTFLLKYRFETYRRLTDCNMPVVLFHGTNDEIIPFQSSVRLKAVLKEEDRLIPLTGGTHNGMSSHPAYRKEISRVLEQPGFHVALTDKK
jgi:pimeloyl-ACP methyl ester carboxylesterase